MDEEERRLETLKAEAAIRELAQRMAEASECTGQANLARSMLESAVRSIDELNVGFRTLIESQKRAIEEESKSLNHACESLEVDAKDLREAQERLENKADLLETSMGERSREFHELLDAKLVILSQDMDTSLGQLARRTEHLEDSVHKQNQEFHESVDAKLVILSQHIDTSLDQLVKRTEHLEDSVHEQNQELYESVDAKLVKLSQNIETISNKLLFVMDQNEASGKRILALQRTVEGLSGKFQEFGNYLVGNSDEIQELETQIIDSNERLSSLEQASEAKTSRFSHRLRSAIIGGGLGVVMVFMIIKLV